MKLSLPKHRIFRYLLYYAVFVFIIALYYATYFTPPPSGWSEILTGFGLIIPTWPAFILPLIIGGETENIIAIVVLLLLIVALISIEKAIGRSLAVDGGPKV